MRLLLLPMTAAAVLGLAACGSSGPPSYWVLITEPSGNITDSTEYLVGNWSCDPQANPDRRTAQPSLWTQVEGQRGQGSLQLDVTCNPGALLTVQVDAAAVAGRPTQLRCEVFNADGDRVTEQSITRGGGTPDPVCRVPVPTSG